MLDVSNTELCIPLIEALSLAEALLDEAGTIIACSPSFAALLASVPQKVRGHSIFDYCSITDLSELSTLSTDQRYSVTLKHAAHLSAGTELSLTATALPASNGTKCFLVKLSTLSSGPYPDAEFQDISAELDLLTKLVATIPNPTFVKDELFRIVAANQAFLEFYPESERPNVIGTTTLEHYDPKDAELFLENDRDAFANGVNAVREQVSFPDGTTRMLHTTKTRIEMPNGERFIVGITNDITEILQTESDLSERDTFQSAFVEAASDGYWDWNIETDTQSISPRFWQMLEFPESTREVGSATSRWQDALAPGQQAIVEKALQQHLEAGADDLFSIESRFTAADNSIRELLVRGRVVSRTETGTAQRMIGTFTDFTAEREAQRALEEQNTLFELAESMAKIGHWRYDPKTAEIEWSAGTFKLHGVSLDAKEPSVTEALEFYHPEDRQEVSSLLQKTLTTGVPFQFKKRLQAADGNLLHVASVGRPEINQAGEIDSVFGVIQDITEATENQEALELANTELEKFAYITSHDLKTPLRGVSNLADWIAEELEDPTPQIQEYLALLKSRTSQLEEMLEDILTYSRIGRLDVTPRTVDCEALLKEIADQLDVSEQFSIEAESDLPTFSTSATALTQVLSNLITNAVKHHDRSSGTVSVGCTLENGHYVFTVTDDGPGIPEQYHHKVFDLFQRLKTRDASPGTGLGLSIVHKLVANIGGEIELISPGDDRGCMFRFSWPRSIQS